MAAQKELPGVERIVNKRVAVLGEKHADAINACTKANAKRKDTKAELIRGMREEKIATYVHIDGGKAIVIDLTDEPKVKLSPYKGKLENDDEKKARKKRGAKIVKDEPDSPEPADDGEVH